MKITTCFRNRQQGAVAIIVGLSLFILIGLLGLVLDLGHLYIAKTELQNAADAAALSGAKQLDGTAAKICCGAGTAEQWAKDTALRNKYDLNSTAVTLTNANLEVSNCPDLNACKWWPIDYHFSDAQAANLTFLKVNTGTQQFKTWFMQVMPSAPTFTATFGRAVAGRYVIQVTPIGVCAVDPTRPEEGFLRGVAYNIRDINPLGTTPDQIWINPIDVYPGACDKNNATPAVTYPYVCAGNAAPITTLPGKVYYDTGNEATLDGPLNSRFGDSSSYTGGMACDPLTAPADTNVREYICTSSGGANPDNCQANPPSNPAPQDWMDPTANSKIPTSQSIEIRPKTDPLYPRKPFNYPVRTSPELLTNFSRYGVLWSYSKEINYTTNPYTTYSATDSDWTKLYGGKPQNYPEPSPYKQFTSSTGVENRRVLNMLIMDCDPNKVEKIGSCKALPVLAIGKFFMPRKADLPQRLYGEFAGLLSTPLPPAEIRLYR